jgi:glutamate--cysteine ligase
MGLSLARGGGECGGRAQGAGHAEGQVFVLDETHSLIALKNSVETRQTPADELIAHSEGDWAGDVTRVFGAYSY